MTSRHAEPPRTDPQPAGFASEPPLVSVVIPTYNQAAFLREAIDSVLAQTYARWECVVVDDGSTDETPDVIASYGNRIVAIRQANAGAARALNEGIRRSHGMLVCWLSSDDVYLPTKLERQVEALTAEPDAGLCCTGWETIDAGGRVLRQYAEPSWQHSDAFVSIFWRNPINGTTAMIPRHVFDKLGPFDETLRADVDADMWLRIAARHRIVTVPDVLARYRVHAGAMSRNISLMRSSKTRVRMARVRDGSLVRRVRAGDGRNAAGVVARIGLEQVRQGLTRLGWVLCLTSLRLGVAPREQGLLVRTLIAAAVPVRVRRAADLAVAMRAVRRVAIRIPGLRAVVRAARNLVRA